MSLFVFNSNDWSGFGKVSKSLFLVLEIGEFSFVFNSNGLNGFWRGGSNSKPLSVFNSDI